MKVDAGVYEPLGLEGYEFCYPEDKHDFERINAEINGAPQQAKWSPIRMRMIREDEGKTLAVADSPWLGSHALIFRPRAIEALGRLLLDYGELLSLECRDANISMYNALQVLDALDEKASTILRFSSGPIMMIKRHVFRPNAVRDVHVFRVPNVRVSPIFVSHHFVETWNAAGLTGLEFKKLWAPD